LSDKANLSLPERDRLTYISYPVYIWWKVEKKEPSHRFIRNFREPVEYMDALWNIDIIQHICDSTEALKVDGRYFKLTPLDFRRFLGVELMRGISGIRNIETFWHTDSSKKFTVDYPGKDNQISKNRWFAISNGVDFDPALVHEMLIALYKFHLVPGYNVTIDELRIPITHESCPFQCLNRDKPDIWAIESKTLHAENGYLLDFINPCQHKVPTPKESVFQFANWLKTTGRHHHLIADSNFLSALDLLDLYDMNIEGTISCKSTRPSFIWKKGLAHKIPKGYSRVASSERLCCVCTRNKGTPKIASTLCYAIDDENRSEVKERRDLLTIYDDLKRKADHFGRLYKAQFPIGHHMNWLISLLIGWFYFTLTNAFILFSMRNAGVTHEEFVFQIALKYMVTE